MPRPRTPTNGRWRRWVLLFVLSLVLAVQPFVWFSCEIHHTF
jgi:hypothetical protein